MEFEHSLSGGEMQGASVTNCIGKLIGQTRHRNQSEEFSFETPYAG